MFFSSCLASLIVFFVFMAAEMQETSGLSLEATRIDRNMIRIYDSLASSLLERVVTGSGNQHWVGIAGPPGAGKSTLSAVSKYLM